MADITNLIKQYEHEAFELRDSIHREPELAFEEVLTAQKVQAFLDRHKIPYQAGIAKTGILATIEGKFPGKIVLLRADMDALPMQENLTHPNPSIFEGKMHACGHDGHTAGLCLAAAVLNQMKDDLQGTVKLMFQPAEEAIGGAEPMIKEGILKGVDGAFGAHLNGQFPKGVATFKVGGVNASPDNFTIIVKGKGGHGSKPQVAIDPIVVSAQIILALQTIISRETDPLDSAVISVGMIHGGSAPNIIPEEVVLEGTIRTFDKRVRKETPEKMERIVKGIAESYRASAQFIYDPAYPVLVNDEKMTRIAQNALNSFLPETDVIELDRPDMGGEDFAYIAQEVPSCFFYIGIAKDKDHPVNHHHPDFDFDNDVISIQSEALIRSALLYLNEKHI